MQTEAIKKFIEEHKAKKHLIKVRCDNEHFYYDNADTQYNAPIIWDWGGECFTVFKVNTDNIMNQETSPMSITVIDFDQIQDIEAYVSPADALEFIKESYTDEKEKEVAMKQLGNYSHPTMRQNSNRVSDPAYDLSNKGNIRTLPKTHVEKS